MKIIIIKLDQDGEYRVPSPNDTEAGAYYTDDKQDAFATARLLYKPYYDWADIIINVRRVRSHS